MSNPTVLLKPPFLGGAGKNEPDPDPILLKSIEEEGRIELGRSKNYQVHSIEVNLGEGWNGG